MNILRLYYKWRLERVCIALNATITQMLLMSATKNYEYLAELRARRFRLEGQMLKYQKRLMP